MLDLKPIRLQHAPHPVFAMAPVNLHGPDGALPPPVQSWEPSAPPPILPGEPDLDRSPTSAIPLSHDD